jgi:histidinol dehydrogenase
MPHELDQILLSHKQKDFKNRLIELRLKVVHAARFKIDSKENEQLRKIVQDIMKRGDEAVAEYTKMFDGVDLIPE